MTGPVKNVIDLAFSARGAEADAMDDLITGNDAFEDPDAE